MYVRHSLKPSALITQAINTYQQLATLLRGEQPKGLLLPGPRGYVASRVRTLADGAVVHEFQWAGGGQWAGKPWSAELPTDTALLLFLFSAFLTVSPHTVDRLQSPQVRRRISCQLCLPIVACPAGRGRAVNWQTLQRRATRRPVLLLFLFLTSLAVVLCLKTYI